MRRKLTAVAGIALATVLAVPTAALADHPGHGGPAPDKKEAGKDAKPEPDKKDAKAEPDKKDAKPTAKDAKGPQGSPSSGEATNPADPAGPPEPSGEEPGVGERKKKDDKKK